ncbi:hypothetical protein [Pseudomonas japonica]|uniref:hypothetical protein n=1 Tax=Pseudomonas japonica TaxID=256466 RepID=UPI0015E44EAD|nr:hypothetical protein [Pseudomonas japonica]MBA1288560.1 hypothetical protein [Pseudomonas japonica]
MTDRKLLILGIGNVALKYLEQALAPYGLQPVVFGDRLGRPAEVWDNLPLSRFHDVALEYAAVERYLRQHAGLAESICAVTTLFDELFPLVEAVAKAHGWDYPGSALARLSDKAVVAELAGELSPQSHAFTACDPEALADVLAVPGLDWVVKPACGSGGQAVGHITGGMGAVGKIRVHLARHFHLNAERWILQQRLEGVLVSFEGYLQGGRLNPVGVSRRSRIGLTEVANRFPPMPAWPRSSWRRAGLPLRNCSSAAVAGMGGFTASASSAPPGFTWWMPMRAVLAARPYWSR